MKSLIYATAEVYTETNTNNFEYKGNVLSEGSLKVSISNYNNQTILNLIKLRLIGKLDFYLIFDFNIKQHFYLNKL